MAVATHRSGLESSPVMGLTGRPVAIVRIGANSMLLRRAPQNLDRAPSAFGDGTPPSLLPMGRSISPLSTNRWRWSLSERAYSSRRLYGFWGCSLKLDPSSVVL